MSESKRPQADSESRYQAVPVTSYDDRRPFAPADCAVFDNLGWGVIAKVGSQFLRLWTCAYALENGPDGPWPFDSAAACQTTLIVGSHHRGADNAFVHAGWNPGDLLPGHALRIDVADGRAAWGIGDRLFVSEPHRWLVQGVHAGVELDLEFRQLSDPYWYRKPTAFSPPAELWLNQLASASGSIVANGNRYEIDGYGWHEHHTHVRRRLDPLTLNDKDGLLFVAAFGSDVSVYAHVRPSRSEGHIVARSGDDVLEFSASELDVQYDDWQRDPRSWSYVPRSYTIQAAGREGRLLLRTYCHERAYYLWPYRDGYALQYWFLARSELDLDVPAWGPNRGTVHLETMVNLNRAFYRSSRQDRTELAGVPRAT